jgi:O-antigen/teichoic acid export membrane protein/peptidoglycan/xylan/chitin deacetylase (PgdA/CDA1 family)
MSIKDIFQGSGIYLAGNMANRAVGFIMIPVYSRFLTPSEYGIVELVELIIQLICLFFGLSGLGVPLSYIYHSENSEITKKKIISTTFLLAFGLSVVGAMIGIYYAPWLSEKVFHGSDYVRLVQLALIAMIFGNMVEIFLVYQRILENAKFFVIYSLGQLFLTITGNIVFIVFLGYGVWGFVLSKLIATGLGCLFLGHSTLKTISAAYDRGIALKIIKMSGPLVLASLAYFVIHSSDRFFINYYTGTADTGVYSLAYRFAFLLTFLVGEPFGRIWNTSVYKYAKEKNWKEQFGRVPMYLLLALALVGLSITLLGGTALRTLVPNSYQGAILLLPVLIFAYMIREFGDFFRSILFVEKRMNTVGIVAFASAVLNIACNFLLIPRFGMFGAAWATLITWMFYMAATIVIAQRLVRFQIHIRSVAVLLGVLMASAALGLIGRQLHLLAAYSLDFFSILLAVTTLWFAGYLKKTEKFAVLDFLKRVLYGAGILRLLHNVRNRRRLTVVMFHRVLPSGDPLWREADPTWTVSVHFFQQCLEFFRRNYNIVCPADVLANADNGHPLPARPLIITFDDGWADTEENALPLLKKAGMTATIFVASGAIGHNKLWSESVLQDWKRGLLNKESHGFLQNWNNSTISSEDGDILSMQRLLAGLGTREEVPKAWLELSTDPVRPLMLNYDQVSSLERNGITIGSHAHSHIPLTLTNDPQAELRISRSLIGRCAKTPDLVSFPHGAYDDCILEASRKVGYRLIFTSDPYLNIVGNFTEGAFVVGRIPIVQATLCDESGTMRPELLACWLFFRPAFRADAKRD